MPIVREKTRTNLGSCLVRNVFMNELLLFDSNKSARSGSIRNEDAPHNAEEQTDHACNSILSLHQILLGNFPFVFSLKPPRLSRNTIVNLIASCTVSLTHAFVDSHIQNCVFFLFTAVRNLSILIKICTSGIEYNRPRDAKWGEERYEVLYSAEW